MKKILLVILFLLLFPSMVLAKDTCNNNDIVIKNVSIENTNGYIEEIAQPNINNNKINLNLEMYNTDDSIIYNITINNKSDEDYYFTKNSFNLNTNYLEYELLNDSEIIKSSEEKSIQLKITYKNQISADEFKENNMMSITLSDTPLTNPDTKRMISLILLVTFITLTIFIINKRKKLEKVLIGILICLIPLSIKALCTINLEINTNITINEKKASFLPGKEVNTKMKMLAGDDISTLASAYTFQDVNITAIKYSNTEPEESEKEEKNIVSTIDSPYPIYMWYEEGTIYWWSEAKRPTLNEDASYMFGYMRNLVDISALSLFDTSITKKMVATFYYDSNLKNLDSLKDWDISNVETLSSLFMNSNAITSLEALSNWNTSNVTNMLQIFMNTNITNLNGLENWNTKKLENLTSAFCNCTQLTSVEQLKNWDTSSLTNLTQTFCGTSLTSLNGLENWNTSHVTKMHSTFQYIRTLTSIEQLKNWDTSNVTNINSIFGQVGLTSLNGLKTWDTSKVKNANSAFFKCQNLKTLQGIENWNIRNITDYSGMFEENTNLVDASAINDWNIQPTANFRAMFNATPTHPEFTKVPGTWSNGTFTPTS